MGRILLHIAAFAVLLSAASLLVGGAQVALGAVAGGLVAVANWVAIRWMAGRIVGGTMRQRAAVTAVLVSKLGVIGLVCWALLVKLELHPVGFLVGVTALVLGVLVGAATEARDVVGEEG